MPTPPTTPEVVPFEIMLDQLSQRLQFKNREKLGLFVRTAVGKVLEAFYNSPKRKMTPEEAQYRVIASSRFEVAVELNVLALNGKGLINLCTFGLKESAYFGMPDGSPKITDPKDLPPLVRRQLVFVRDLKPPQKEVWVGTNYLKKRVEECDDKDLTIDIQTK